MPPIDPEVVAIVEQLSGVSSTDVISIVGSQTGGFGLVLFFAWKRLQAAEEKLECLLDLSKQIVKREKAQHKFNKQVWKATELIVKRLGGIRCGSGDADMDVLSLGPSPVEEDD